MSDNNNTQNKDKLKMLSDILKSYTTKPYENVSHIFDAELEKSKENTVLCNHYFQKVQTVMKSVGFVPVDYMETCRIAFYAEDIETNTKDFLNLRGKPEEAEEFVYNLEKFLKYNYKRNPEYFQNIFVPAELADGNEVDIREEEVGEDQSDPETINENEEEEETESDGMKDFITGLLEKNNEDDSETVYTNTDARPFELGLHQATQELESIRKGQLEKQLSAALSNILNLKSADKSDFLIALSESVQLKNVMAHIFTLMGIEIQTTRVSNDGVLSSILNFKNRIGDASITMDEIAKGMAFLEVYIKEYNSQRKEFADFKKDKTKLTEETVSLTRRLSETSAKLDAANTEIERLKNIPKLSDAREIWHHIAWKEDGEIYYLATTADSETASGTYQIASLVKTKKKTEAIRFKDKEILKAQKEKINRFYSKINRDQKISLKSINESFTVSRLEHIDETKTVRPIVRDVK